MTTSDWIHHYQKGSSDATLLLLHGTGGNEHQLFDIGQQVAPTANLLGVRGRSMDEGSPRFLRRFTATKYDQPHLLAEADALAEFVQDAAQTYGFDPSKVIALGYSNGANIALTALARHPEVFAGAVLIRPVMPMEEPPQTALNDLPVLVLHGARDSFLPFGESITPYLTKMGAQVEEHRLNTGHELAQEDLMLTAAWLGNVTRAN